MLRIFLRGLAIKVAVLTRQVSKCGVDVGLYSFDCALRRSVACDIARIHVRESLSRTSVDSVLNSRVAMESKLFGGPFPGGTSGLFFHMVSISVNIGAGVSGSGVSQCASPSCNCKGIIVVVRNRKRE